MSADSIEMLNTDEHKPILPIVGTWVCLANLTDAEFFEVCQLVRQAGAGPGHTCTLRLIREENFKVDEKVEKLQTFVAKAVQMVSEATKGGQADAFLAEAQALLMHISSLPESVPNIIAARALDLVNTATKTDTTHRNLQRLMQDILVLCCCRNVDHSDVKALRCAFTAAFGPGRDIQNEGLIARLLNSRWQLFERNTPSGSAENCCRKKNASEIKIIKM